MKKTLLLLFSILGFLCTQAEPPWKAVWISHEGCQSLPNQWLCLKTTTSIDQIPSQAIARIAADSKYWLWINGRMVVFEGGLKRGPAPGASYYDEVDIAPFLQRGENTIAALIWYFGKNGFSHASSGQAAFLFDCQAPGVEILSDNRWKCITYEAYQNTDAPHPNYRLSESNIRFDARLALEGWYLPGVDKITGGAMMAADVNRPPHGRLVKRPIPQWRNSGLQDYASVERIGDTLFCKLPYNAQFTPWFQIETARAGDTLRMITDNYTTGNGTAYSVRAEYITRAGEQTYENLGWMSGHIMKYILPKDVTVKAVKYRETGYDADIAGSFRCNDPFLNELWKRAARTLYVNMRDTYFDCPERERAQWWGDVVNELGQAFYALDPRGQQLARKGILELMNWQRNDGVIFSPVPAGGWTRELPLQMLAAVGWYGFYTQSFFSGDDSFLPLIYDRLHRYLHEVWQMGNDGLVLFRPSDWNWGDSGPNQDMKVLTNGWYYLALKAEREFARQLGKTTDIEAIDARMKLIEQNFNRQFWTGTAYRSPDYTLDTDDRAQALAVLSGLASEDKYPALTEVLSQEYHAGPYMERFILEALFRMNQPDLALQRMHKRYANMLQYDYSTLFEVWQFKATPTDGNSNNHAWSGGPLMLLSQYVCGIAPTSPGFRTFRIAPQLGPLTEVSATVPSHYGTIHASIVRQGRVLTLTVTVPEGTSAEICFPSGRCVSLCAGTHTLKGR